MKLIIEDEGISLLENKGQYYLQYDAGAHMIKKKRIEITNEEAEFCLLDVEELYNLILQYQYFMTPKPLTQKAILISACSRSE